MHKEIISLLTAWAAKGAIRQLDLALAKFIAEQDPAASPSVLLATALVSQRNAEGHVCLSLASVLNEPEILFTEDERLISQQTVGAELANLLKGLSLKAWIKELCASQAVFQAFPNQLDSTKGIEAVTCPLVLAGDEHQPLLYLRRYWVYEQQIKTALAARLATPLAIDLAATQALLNSLFTNANSQLNQQLDWQKLACALAARSSFSLITGGPGTGKTTTVVRLLALLQGLQLKAGLEPLTIYLAAPTGKAAARLSESLAANLARLNLPEEVAKCREYLPTEVTTLHRLLGNQTGTRHFRHNAANPLAADLLVVDEASMVDVEMLATLLAALSPKTRLILLGDKDQLASVEAGSVLGDFCLNADAGNYTPATANWLEAATGQRLAKNFIYEQGKALDQVTCKLRHSYRFASYPGIGKLAELVNTGTASLAQLKQVFSQYYAAEMQPAASFSPQANLNLIELAPSNLTPLKQLIKQGYSRYLDVLLTQQPATPNQEALDAWALKIFAAQQSFQLLTAVRKGAFGLDALNQLSLASLKEVPRFNPLLSSAGQWYFGRPVLITRNDYSLKLMNGDLGVCLEVPANLDNPTGKKVLRVAFPKGAGGVRWVLPSRLQGAETVFALTVHKSQGSEFTHTALVLPAVDNPVLTKELLYTGITRSSQAFTLVCPQEKVLAAALVKQVNRISGLRNWN